MDDVFIIYYILYTIYIVELLQICLVLYHPQQIVGFFVEPGGVSS